MKVITLILLFIPIVVSGNSWQSIKIVAQEPENNHKPNILFVLLDDLGKEWVSKYNADDIETPNIDQLAKQGMQFINAWSMPQCTPSRITFMTGQYPYNHGWVNHYDVPRWGSWC